MNKIVIGVYTIMLVIILVGCAPVTISPPVTPSISPSITNTPPPTFTATSTATVTPTITATATAPYTRTAVSPKTPRSLSTEEVAEATVESFGTICQPPTEDSPSKISPNGHWIATICEGRGEYGEVVAYLRVFSVQGDKAWSIYHTDYTRGLEEYTDGVIYPFHWSTDGKYLYAVSPSRFSGCCWVGGLMLLVRINLATGQQTEIANYMSDDGVMGVGFSISPGNRYVLITPQDGKANLYILDTYTWKQRVIKLNVNDRGSAGEALMSPNDKKVILVFREYPVEYQGDLTYGSVVLIDLENGSQTRLLSGMEFHDTPKPWGWQDNSHVLMYDGRDYWILDIQTAELIKTGKP